MLKSLAIRNIAVIENVNIEFNSGFNLLTGETGAGKSIIIDSLNLLKGERMPHSLIRNGEVKARVDGVFDVDDKMAEELNELFGIECDGELVISREISSDSKGSVRINGLPTTLAVLKNVGTMLINIHGQHDNTSLLSKKTHISFLDSYGGEEVQRAKSDYLEVYGKLQKVIGDIERFDVDEKETARRAELLKFQIDEIEMSALAIGEDEELENKKAVLENAMKIVTNATKAHTTLYEGEDYHRSAYDSLSEAQKALESIAQYDEGLSEICDRLSEAADTIYDCARELKNFCDGVENTGFELDEIDTRLEQIHTLKLKYGETIEAILKKCNDFKEELNTLNCGAQNIEELKKQKALYEQEIAEKAKALSQIRKQYATKLNDAIGKELCDLEMAGVEFGTNITKTDYRPDGADLVEFVICTNKGEGVKPLADVASGGELSRVMLAVKSVLNDMYNPLVMIFDEIDTGVSGRTAQRIGEKLWCMAQHTQTLCISHLPQIASMADSHYKIQKHTDSGRTYTEVSLLDQDEHIREIARMLGGETITDAAVNNAEELVCLADSFKIQKGE